MRKFLDGFQQFQPLAFTHAARYEASKETRKNNFTFSGGVDVAQALLPAGVETFSTPLPAGCRSNAA